MEKDCMEITHEDALDILRMAEVCYDEGLLQPGGKQLALQILERFDFQQNDPEVIQRKLWLGFLRDD